VKDAKIERERERKKKGEKETAREKGGEKEIKREREREIERERERAIVQIFVHTRRDTPARTHELVHARTYTNINTHTQTYDMRICIIIRGLFIHTLLIHTYTEFPTVRCRAHPSIDML
jgi:hypothetical protein